MNLFGATDVLRLVTSSAANLDVVALHASTDGSITTKGKTRTAIAAAATTEIVPAPGVDFERTVYDLKIRNRHASLANTITLQDFDGATAFELFKVVLAAGEALVYDGISGWTYLNAQGQPRAAFAQGSAAPFLGIEQSSVLAADVTNNNAVANTIQDITGLSFPVLAGFKYAFEFLIDWTSAATTTGARFSITGPAFSRLTYRSAYAASATGDTINNLTAYDLPAAANSAPAAVAGNLAKIEGFIQPSADGNVIARFASEIASSAIVAKAGSRVRWTQVT
jgi:hypothetical protein